MGLRTVGVRLTAEVSSYMTNLKRAGGSTRDLVGEMSKAAKSGHLDAVADRAGAVGFALAGMAGYAIKSAADFDKSMSAVKAASYDSSKSVDQNAESMRQLRAAALQAGKDTQYSATGAADAITELSKAGVSTADVLSGGLKGALSLAAAGQLDVGEAAETAASAMTQFKLSGDKIPHVADLLSAAAGKAQGSVHDVGAALNQSGLVAAQFGLSIEDTTGALAEFASAGLTGSDAGTSFKTMLLAMANPSGVTLRNMRDLGISFYDAQGKFIGLTGVAEMLRQKLGGLSEEQRNAALGQIFGSDAIRAATILYKDGAAGVEKWRGAVNDSGFAARTAATLTDNLAGDVERLKGSLETMAIEAGGGANGGLRVLVKGLGALVDRFGSLPPVVGSTLTVMAGLGGGLALLGAAWVKATRASATFRAELEKTGPAGTKAAAGLQAVGKHAAKAGAVFAGLQIAGVALSAAIGDLNPQIDALAVGMEKFASSGDVSGEAARLLGGDMGKLDQALHDVADTGRWSSFVRITGGALEGLGVGLDKVDLSLSNSRQRLSALDQALQQMVQGGNAAQAAQIFKSIADRAAEQGVSVDELRKVLPGYAGALETAGKASKGAAGATGDLNSAFKVGAGDQDGYKTKAAAVAGVIRGETDAIIALSDQLKAQADPAFAFVSAQQAMTKAQKEATKAVKEHKAGSVEAREANQTLVTAALDLQQAAGKVASTFDGKLDPAMRATLKTAGLTPAQIANIAKEFRQAKKDGDAYAKKYEGLTSAPGAKQAKKELDQAYTSANHFAGPYAATISTPGAKAADTQIKGLWDKLKGVDGNWVAHLSTPGYTKVASDLRHLLAAQRALKENTSVNEANRELGHFFATGGPVYGPGTGTSDEINARLSNGEHVWTADEVAAIGGQGAMLQLRRAVKSGKRVEIGDEAPGFAQGGVVMPFPADIRATKIPPDIWSGPPAGGATDDWIVRTVKARFPGMNYISKFRAGAVTLTGNSSYHSKHRAVDWPASYALAKYWHDTFMGKTKELITPWNNLNIHNGAPHRYTGAVWNQHNFAGGNAHDHIAMRNGGTIREPVYGIGASGRSYSFGENYQPERVTPNWQGAGSGGGGLTVVLENHGVIGSRMEVENWLTGAVDRLRLRGRV